MHEVDLPFRCGQGRLDESTVEREAWFVTWSEGCAGQTFRAGWVVRCAHDIGAGEGEEECGRVRHNLESIKEVPAGEGWNYFS